MSDYEVIDGAERNDPNYWIILFKGKILCKISKIGNSYEKVRKMFSE